MWPHPWRVRSAEFGSRLCAVSAPSYLVAGSKRLPTTSTGAVVVRLNGPVYRSASAAGHCAQMLVIHVQSGPK